MAMMGRMTNGEWSRLPEQVLAREIDRTDRMWFWCLRVEGEILVAQMALGTMLRPGWQCPHALRSRVDGVRRVLQEQKQEVAAVRDELMKELDALTPQASYSQSMVAPVDEEE